jgi:hypothetical protein
VAASGMDFDRLAAGRIAETWSTWDTLALLQ